MLQRPADGYDPDKCIFEAAVYEFYPKGKEPETEWEYTPADDPRWGSVLPQDFSNMAAVQQGMKSRASAVRSPIHIGSAASPIFTAIWQDTWAPAHHARSRRIPNSGRRIRADQYP